MAAGRYRFHCTDGVNVEVDGAGKRAPNEGYIRGFADRAARAVMERYGPGLDWSDWFVDVHDANGRRVMTLAFE